MDILITGASRGIGAALTRVFAVKGDHQIFILARNKENLEMLAFQCTKLNKNTRVVPVISDLSLINELEGTAEKILSLTSSIDILVNNAGMSLRKSFEEINIKEAEAMMAVNFYAPATLIRLLIPALSISGRSHVVNIGSMAGFQGALKFKGLSMYGSSKAALASLTEALSIEYKDRGISFNCLAIGAVQTDMFQEVFPEFKAPLYPDKMAEFIAEFSLNAHKYLNGKVIPVSLANP